ncbi:hypothetical protein M413DRAFT_68581 [Hebeloma cylindrosporum]|uniref:UBX domain-containing protein n=1 Tax=Hebeloma cylindrosporum TaxID=76867 RepID=A0A0C2YRK2_HEBCY|nr:hypothetical protein M413DRAFT_68581 [Hebeloma cylindrosporum h7]
MDSLDDIQRHAVLQLRELINGADEDVAVSVLSSVEWDVQRAAELIFGTSISANPPIPSRTPDVQPFEIDDSQQGEFAAPRHLAPPSYSLLRPVWSILAFPIHILSSVFRFIFGVLRIPFPQFRFTSLNFYRPLRPRTSTRGGPDRWLRELEEETGAISISRSNLPRGTTSSVTTDPQSSLTARSSNTAGPTEDGRKLLPDFTICSYEEMLRTCQREAKIGCVILVSEEHDDVPAFKRTTLTDPTFVKKLYDNNIIVWGGDVRDQEAWSASEKLQATTYPFVAFLALQPRRNPSSSSRTSPPSLTVLSRHQGKSTPSSGPTSATTLIEHLERQLLPRVSPFLDRIIAAERERSRDRHLREEQDRAFQNAARRDKERIEAKMAEERARLEAKRMEEEEARLASQRKAREVEIARQKESNRMEWRRWTRSAIIQPSSSSGASSSGPLRIAIRLPTGSRVVRSFSQNATLTSLYAFVDSQFIPPQFDPADDPTSLPDLAGVGENALESHISKAGPAEEYWGFRIALAYPRMEIPWKQRTKLLDITHLKGGGQVVVETIEGRRTPVQNGNTDTEDSE